MTSPAHPNPEPFSLPVLFVALFLLVFFSQATCGGGNPPEYSPEEDETAVTMLEKCWLPTAQGGLVLALWEDHDTADAHADGTCGVEHVVRGHGKGNRHRGTEPGAGCGGCPMEVVAFVDGTVEQGPFDDEVKVTGKVILGSNFDENPYAFPYQVELDGVSGDDSYRITGELFEDGTVDLKVSLPGSGWSDPVGTHSLEPVELEGGF